MAIGMKNDLTTGNIYEKIMLFTLPILLSNILQQFYSIADNTIVGNILGRDALAAVGASCQINSIILAIAMGLTLGMGILISNAYGAKQVDTIQKIVDTGFVMCMILAVIITMIGVFYAKRILLCFQVPDSIIQQAALYFRLICLGTIPSFGYNAVVNYLRGVGDSKTALIFLIISSVLNIILDIVLVASIGEGVAGAAMATVISQFVAFFGICSYVNQKKSEFSIRFRHLSFEWDILKKGLWIGIPATLQQLFLGIGNSIIQYMINGYGATLIAAYTAASKIDGLATLPAVNIGKAMSNFIAQNRGAGNEERVKAGTRASIIIITAISVLFSVMIFTMSGSLLKLFCTDEEVCAQGIKYLQMVSIFYFIFGIMQCLNGVLLGIDKSNLSLLGSILSFCLFQVPLAVVLSRFIGVTGIWLAAPFGWIAGMTLRVIFIWNINRNAKKNTISHLVI